MADPADWKVTWVDGGRWPQNRPNPAYPDGVDIPARDASLPACKGDLPYPARRCGHHIVECQRCHQVCLVTTAGRPDDPRSLTLNCVEGGTLQ